MAEDELEAGGSAGLETGFDDEDVLAFLLVGESSEVGSSDVIVLLLPPQTQFQMLLDPEVEGLGWAGSLLKKMISPLLDF